MSKWPNLSKLVKAETMHPTGRINIVMLICMAISSGALVQIGIKNTSTSSITPELGYVGLMSMIVAGIFQEVENYFANEKN